MRSMRDSSPSSPPFPCVTHPILLGSRESPVDCSVTKRTRHMSNNDGGQLAYQASYPEPRTSPQTTTPPSSVTEEKRVIVPAGELFPVSLWRTHTHTYHLFSHLQTVKVRPPKKCIRITSISTYDCLWNELVLLVCIQIIFYSQTYVNIMLSITAVVVQIMWLHMNCMLCELSIDNYVFQKALQHGRFCTVVFCRPQYHIHYYLELVSRNVTEINFHTVQLNAEWLQSKTVNLNLPTFT